jgi:diguanylate cyclase (GGDEF)-like protein
MRSARGCLTQFLGSYRTFFLAVRRVFRDGLVSAAVLLLCAGVALPAQEYSLRHFTGADGLANLSIQSLYQDHEGFLWVSTENGLFRYGGDRFEAFGPAQGLPSEFAFAMGEAPDGRILAGATTGLYRLSGVGFEHLPTPFHTVFWGQGIALVPTGRTYLATDQGLYELTPATSGSPQPYTYRRLYPSSADAAQPVYSVFREPNSDSLWFGCGLNVCHLTSSGVQTYTSEDGLPGIAIAFVVKDRDGAVWIRPRNKGVLVLPANETRFRRPEGPLSVYNGALGLDHSGRVLIASSSGLLIHAGSGWQFLDRRAGIRGDIFSILEDRQHSLWLGTGGRGLTQWRGYGDWENYTSLSGLPNDSVFEVLPLADGSVWAATESGVVHGEPRGESFEWRPSPEIGAVPAHSLQMTPEGDLWVGTAAKGIARYSVKTRHVQWFGPAEGLMGKLALTVRFDQKRRLWAATEAGLFFSDAPYKKFARAEGVPASWFWTIAETPDGTLWAVSTEGLFALAAGKWRHWDRASGLSNQDVVSLGAAPDNSVYVGYHHGGGIDRVRLSAKGMEIQTGLQRPGTDGLIYFLTFDRSGHLWAGTEHGVEVFDGARWTHYDSTDGLVWDDCDLGGFAAAADGSFWIGTSGGLSHLHPQPPASTDAPHVLFTGLTVGTSDVSERKQPSFPLNAGALVAHFAAPDALQDSNILFRYRLSGATSHFTETVEHQVEFAALAPGSYKLQVQVRDNRGEWSPHEATYAFSILTPWYRRGWFLTLLALVPFLVAVIVLRVRSLAAVRREVQLERIVAEKTADLRRANEELLLLSNVDALTGIANRRHFDQTLLSECERVRRSDSVLSLLLVDVDHFKALNDSAGHQKGDEYLMQLGRLLSLIARRQIDLAARIGGEEFAVVLPATDAREASRIGEAVRARVEALALAHAGSQSGVVTVSVGIATATPGAPRTPEALVAAADQALYRAKGKGRNRVESA